MRQEWNLGVVDERGLPLRGLVSYVPNVVESGVVDLDIWQKKITWLLGSNPVQRRLLESKMHHNSEVTKLKECVFGNDRSRPLSVFYFIGSQGVWLMEGAINTSWQAAIHTDLRYSQVYAELETLAERVYSGHVWRVPQTQVSIALFDCVETVEELVQNPVLVRSVDALSASGYVCVGTTARPLVVCG